MLKKYYSRVSKLSTKGKSNFKSLILPRFRSFARNLMTSNTEKITSVYRDISKIPFVEQGWINPSKPSQLLVQYSQRDVITKQKYKFLRTFQEREDHFTYQAAPFGFSMSNVVGFEPSPTWKYLCVIRSIKKESDKDEKYAIEIWDNGYLINTIPTEGIHAQVYADIWFGSIAWSKDENYIAYIAEKQPPKTGSFYDKSKEDVTLGNKFDYKEDWGETYKGANPSIFIVSIKDEKIKAISDIPDDLSVGQVQWSPNLEKIVFTGWNTNPRRLGILHCYNRPSSIYSLKLDLSTLFLEENESKMELEKLSHLNSINRSPRFSPDGKRLVYFSSDHDKTHNSCSKLLSLDWETGKEEVIIDIVEEYPANNAFPGLFTGSFPTRPFINNQKLLVSSIWKSITSSLLIDLETKEVKKIYAPGCENTNISVRDVRVNSYALFDGSEFNRIPFPIVGKWQDGDFEWSIPCHSPILSQQGMGISTTQWVIHTAPYETSSEFPGVEYILSVPTFATPQKKYPVILFPHGGPHSTSIPSFSVSQAFFTRLGYAVIYINFRGSLGFGQKYVDALPGHCGDKDVEDCLLALKNALHRYPNILDKDNLFVMGGSHGGYLTGHLIAREEVKWRASVMINAVTNMAHCVGISDIPDWCFVESGTTELSSETLKIMFEKSPIAHIHKVKAPTMIVLGDSDKRVPISQSIEYYHKLKSNGVKTRMLKYPGEGHGIGETEHESDYLINIALWFQEHLQ